jgi:hypothetical protein
MSKSKNSAGSVSSIPFTLNNYFEFEGWDQHFEFEGWDQQDTTEFTFYDCTVLHPFGPFKKGQAIDAIDVNFNSGTIQAVEVYDTKQKVLFCGYLVMNIVKREDIPEDDEYSIYVRD